MTAATVPCSPPDLSLRSLERLAAIACRAGETAMTFYGRPGVVHHKGDDGPLTEADRASQRVIVEALSAWSHLPIVSEEMDVPDYEVRKRWERLWIVDPLDGTKEFLAENGEFTVNIALVEGDRPVLGVVFAPALRQLYYAGSGLGSWRRNGDGPVERLYSSPPAPGKPLRVVESRSHQSAAHEQYLATIDVSERIPIGSSLKFCRVAEGRADVYPRLVPVMEWDVAAGDCVYRYSGRDGDRASPLRYNRPELRIPSFVLGV